MAIRAFKNSEPNGGIRSKMSAGEENGCHGARHLFKDGNEIGEARMQVLGELTFYKLFIVHKGGLVKGFFSTGVAHSFILHLGDDVIYKGARTISTIEISTIEYSKFDVGENRLLAI